MLSQDDAFAIANARLPCYLEPENTDGDVVAPITARLRYRSDPYDMQRCVPLKETLQLWHALASCPGYSAAENPSFWARVVRNISGSDVGHPNFDRARFFPDLKLHPFPLDITSENPDSTLTQEQLVAFYRPVTQFLTKLVDPNPSSDPPSAELVAALESLVESINPAVSARPIPVRLVCRVPCFDMSNDRHDHQTRTWAVNAFISVIHDWLVGLPRECTTVWSDHAMISTTTDDGAPRTPRFVVEAVDLMEIHDVRVAMSRELQSLLEDTRLGHIAFPHIGIEKIHQSTRPKTVRRFLRQLLRPSSMIRPLVPSPRLPQSLTLTLTDDGTDCSVGANVELFFQLLPFTQSIQSLTLRGMNRCRQWGWLGFALFHPAAQDSSLRKLTIATTRFNLGSVTLRLYLEAMHLQLSSADEFKAIVDGYDPRMTRMRAAWPSPPALEDVDVSMLPVTSIERVTVNFTVALASNSSWRHGNRDSYNLCHWASFLVTLAPTLKCIHIKPLRERTLIWYGYILLSMQSDHLLTLVHKCHRLREAAMPATG